MKLIHWSPNAVRQLRNLEPHRQAPIVNAVTTLQQMPDCGNVSALRRHACGYRLLVENCRVLFDWDGGVRIVEIQQTRRRDERTR